MPIVRVQSRADEHLYETAVKVKSIAAGHEHDVVVILPFHFNRFRRFFRCSPFPTTFP